ncbi:MAG TPA: aromatic amino acid hydroxylase [Candidatus Acidoferrum sp.]|nr:aromatic amino acid hydroxylase [Candidatus Acidoferrum sp.]
MRQDQRPSKAEPAAGTQPNRPIWEIVDNENLKRLPRHLRQFVVDQQYDKYTPIDHAVWRYVMRQNLSFLKDHAHEAYVDGLRRTGISVERIPSIFEMNEILARIGWACVTVDGFIPPAAFMEYQAYRVLVVAADMRQINHIEYTPAPDIIHEAAGHAPIIADPEYAEYLRRIGEIGARAISSRRDFELYQAIRHLSILKEMPDADPAEVENSERDVMERQQNLGTPSEMAKLSRLHWWTVEYGLIGDLNNPKIYGAGLLSSIGESANCLTDRVRKLPYGLDTAEYAFDITTQQPQLFVTPNFQHLIDVLEQFADTMALRTGGAEGLEKAVECNNVCTAVYSSGLQVTGRISKVLSGKDGQPAYLQLSGPSALAVDFKQLDGQGKDYHKDGFGSPVGKIRGASKPLERMTDSDLSSLGIRQGAKSWINFENGVVVDGHLDRILRHNGNIVLMTFTECRVQKDGMVLFQPSWGVYDMAVGENIVSVFCGAADQDAYEQVSLVPRERTIKQVYDDRTIALQGLYREIRNYREENRTDDAIIRVWETVRREHSDDWLAALEILELLLTRNIYPERTQAVREFLASKTSSQPELKKLIGDGLRLLETRAAA